MSRALDADKRLSVRVVEDLDFITQPEASQLDVLVLHFCDAK